MLKFSDWMVFIECFGQLTITEGRMNSPEQQFDQYANQGLKQALQTLLSKNLLVKPDNPQAQEIVQQVRQIIEDNTGKFNWGKALRESAMFRGHARFGSQDVEDIGSEIILTFFEKYFNPALYSPKQTFADMHWGDGLRTNVWSWIRSMTSYQGTPLHAPSKVNDPRQKQISQFGDPAKGNRSFDVKSDDDARTNQRYEMEDLISKVVGVAREYAADFSRQLQDTYGTKRNAEGRITLDFEKIKNQDRVKLAHVNNAVRIMPYLLEFPFVHRFDHQGKVGEAIAFAQQALRQQGDEQGADEIAARTGGGHQQYLMNIVYEMIAMAKEQHPDLAEKIDHVMAHVVGRVKKKAEELAGEPTGVS